MNHVPKTASRAEFFSSLLGLQSQKADPRSVFSWVAALFDRFRVQKAAIDFSVTETGMPIVSPNVEFGGKQEGQVSIYCDEFLLALQEALESVRATVWLLIDRLDEAFVGFPDVETPALRALLRTYLDLKEFPSLQLKLFLRRDLFRRVTAGGFVNLSHVNAMRIDIEWEVADLVAMLEERMKNSPKFLVDLNYSNDDGIRLFDRIFPGQIDVGERKPTAEGWIMSRIRDGKGIKPPRNLIDLAIKARENQIRAEKIKPRGEVSISDALISIDSVRDGHKQLSQIRVDDTLLAEAGHLSKYIERFKDGKSEHNRDSLYQVLDLAGEQAQVVIKALVEMGFLEEVGANFKVPMLYRDGLNITQGKAFA